MEELMEIKRKTITIMATTNSKLKELKNKYNNDVQELKIRYGLTTLAMDSDMSEHFCNNTNQLTTNNKSTQHGRKKKRFNSIETQSSQESNSSMAQLSDRPTRIAKVKAGTKLKEPNLNLKMRKPSIKVERISRMDADVIKNPDKSSGKSNDEQKENKRNTVHIKNENVSLNNNNSEMTDSLTSTTDTSKYVKANKLVSSEKRKSNHDENHDDSALLSNAKKLDDSLIYVSKNDVVIVELSDDDCNKMPPPALPPPSITKSSTAKRSARTKKKRNTKKNSILNDVKQERNSSTVENDSCSINAIGSNVSITTMSSSSLSVPSTRSKTRKGRIDVKPIKEEIIMEEEEPRDVIQRKLINATIESVYIDAESTVSQSDEQCVFTTKSKDNNELIQQKPTYIITNGNINNNNIEIPIITAIESLPDSLATGNVTFNIETSNTNNHEPKLKQPNDLITDDESDCDDDPIAYKIETRPINTNTRIPSKKIQNKNELFNPLLKSPLSSKIAAFETAIIIQNSNKKEQGLRQTRSKQQGTKIETSNTILQESNAINTQSSTTKITTPFLSTINKVNSTTPSSQSTTKLLLSEQQKSLSNHNSRLNATSKLAHLNQTRNTSKSRENSAEDIKRGIQAVAEEKKRKREEKIRHVQQQREAREKEKMDKYKQQVEEKNEKLRQDAAKKREQKEQKERERKLLEEIHKNLKLQQNNNNDTFTIPIQTSESRQQTQLEDNHKKKTVELMVINPFDLLECDASTDEESHDSKPRKGPPIPEWSKGAKREECIKLQQHIPSAIIDSFFSVEPMTPDLREIFPTIRERFLRRNSSAIWNSPLPYP